MAKFDLKIVEKLERKFIVEAETLKEAFSKLYDYYNNFEIVLDDSDFVEAYIIDSDETTQKYL